MKSSAKKPQLTIKPLRQPPKLPEDFYASNWEKLRQALSAVFAAAPLEGVGKEELYRTVEDLCLHKHSEKLYQQLSFECKQFIQGRMAALWAKRDLCNSEDCLKSFDTIWEEHCQVIQVVRNIFIYLDRSYALASGSSGVKNIWDLCLDYLRYYLASHAELEMQLITALLANIEADRQGQRVDADMLKRVLAMFMALGVYKLKFEAPLLLDSRRFFLGEGQQRMEACDTSQFLEHVEKRIVEATDMSSSARYLDVSTRAPLIQIIEQCLFQPHVATLLARGLAGLLQYDADAASSASGVVQPRAIDLKRFFQLMARIGRLDDLRAAWVAHIRKVGEALVSEDEKREKTLIEDLIALNDRAVWTLSAAFNSDDEFRQSLKQAMFQVVNVKVNRVAELLARYVDRKLRGEKGMQETDTEQAFDRVLALFKLIQGKDVFEAFYKKLLAKRLLLAKSASTELEKSMLSRLKTECGSSYTAKLEGMFQDIELSRDIMLTYSSHLSRAGAEPLPGPGEAEIAIQVLTTGYWPATPNMPSLVIPHSPFGALMQKFDAFYREKYCGRRLAWSHAAERCLVTARFGKSKAKKELEVSFYQALVLLCFKDPATQQLSLSALQALTGIDHGELCRTLQSLACGVLGTRVLTKTPRGKEVEAQDVFSVNEDFSNKLYRIKINSIQLKESVEEVEKTHEEVFRERQYQVDAAIVRIMKTRKRMAHALLLGELMAQLKFPARSSDIKQRIESLIERDYLERDKDDATVYNYRA